MQDDQERNIDWKPKLEIVLPGVSEAWDDKAHIREPSVHRKPERVPSPQLSSLLQQPEPGQLEQAPVWRSLPSVEVVVHRYADVQRMRSLKAASQVAEAGTQSQSDIALSDSRPPNPVKAEPQDDDVKLDLPKSLDSLDVQAQQEALRAAVEDLKNPDVKIKKELLLSDAFFLSALSWEGINHKYAVPLPKEIAEYPLRRDYITQMYGGNMQDVTPTPRKELLEWHGLDDWFFLSLDYNPHAPTKPGSSGLAFGIGLDQTVLRRTFVRFGPQRWVYMGQYQTSPGTSLTVEEFRGQKPSVRRAWARGTLNKQWGTTALIDVWLRRVHGPNYVATEEDYTEGEARLKEIRRTITEDDILDAFDGGDEIMNTVTMVCVGYDEDFIRVLVRNADRFVPPERKTVAKKQTGQGTGSKRKPIELESEVEDEEHPTEGRPARVGRTTQSRARGKRTRT